MCNQAHMSGLTFLHEGIFFNAAVRYSVYYKKSRIEDRKSAMLYKVIDYIQFYIH
jgi:hypothetical protein